MSFTTDSSDEWATVFLTRGLYMLFCSVDLRRSNFEITRRRLASAMKLDFYSSGLCRRSVGLGFNGLIHCFVRSVSAPTLPLPAASASNETGRVLALIDRLPSSLRHQLGISAQRKFAIAGIHVCPLAMPYQHPASPQRSTPKDGFRSATRIRIRLRTLNSNLAISVCCVPGQGVRKGTPSRLPNTVDLLIVHHFGSHQSLCILPDV